MGLTLRFPKIVYQLEILLYTGFYDQKSFQNVLVNKNNFSQVYELIFIKFAYHDVSTCPVTFVFLYLSLFLFLF